MTTSRWPISVLVLGCSAAVVAACAGETGGRRGELVDVLVDRAGLSREVADCAADGMMERFDDRTIDRILLDGRPGEDRGAEFSDVIADCTADGGDRPESDPVGDPGP